MRITSVVEGVSGFGAGVRAFKTAMKLLGVFTSNTMPDPVNVLEGKNLQLVRQILVQTGLLDD